MGEDSTNLPWLILPGGGGDYVRIFKDTLMREGRNVKKKNKLLTNFFNGFLRLSIEDCILALFLASSSFIDKSVCKIYFFMIKVCKKILSFTCL